MYQFIITSPANKTSTAKLLFYQTKKSNWSLLKIRPISSTSSNFQSSTDSASSPKTKSTRKGLKLVALALTGFTIGIGYATLNPDSRRQIESYVPQSQHLFDYIDQFLNTNKNKFDRFESKNSAPSTETRLPSAPSPVVKNDNKQQEKPKIETKTEPVAVAVDKQDWKKTLKELDLKEEASINAIETKLNQLDDLIKLKVSDALNSSYVAIESLNKYRQALRNALDDSKNDGLSKELEWRQVTDLFDLQTNDVNESNEKFLIAKNHLEELDNYLKQVKQNDLNRKVKNLKQSQIDLVNQFRRLQVEQNKLSEAIAHANVLKNYTQEQKVARNQFLKEIQALQPEGIQRSATGDQLSNEEINSLLIHAHKRVLQLQKQIEKIQLNQNKQIEAALEEQRNQNLKFIKEHDTELYNLHKKEFEIDLEKALEDERLRAQEELKKELSRQAAAHNNHLAQMLRIQQEELNSLYEKKLLIENEKIRSSFYSMVSEGLGRLNGIQQSLNARANLELQANNAKQLWLAVQNLSEILQTKSEDLNNNSSELVSIKSNIHKINESAPNNEFIQKIIKSVSERALTNGIWTEPDLKDRFSKLKKACNQVALIDDRGGSLFKYFISYLQSFIIIHPKIDRTKLDENLVLDEISFNTFNILDYAEYYLENGNLEYALRLMQQLKGEPKRLSRDWINDACLLLEIKQACNLLNAYISSIYIGTNLK